MRVRKKEIKFPALGNYRIRIVVTKDVRKYMLTCSEFKDIAMDGEHADTYAITLHQVGNNLTYIIFPFGASVGSIAHECWHAVRKMLLHLNAKLDNEVVAYHLGYLVNQVYRIVWKNK